MAKPKLTLQQRRRIREQRARSSSAPEKDDLLTTLLSSGQLGHEQNGLVVTRYSNQADILFEDAPESPLRKCYFRSHLDSLVTGDRVRCRDGEPYGVICSVLPRKSQLERPDNRGNICTVVANIDTIVIVVAPEPQARSGLIDRYLIACEHHQISPLIVVNKIDLDPQQVERTFSLTAPYKDIGYPVLAVSASSGEGINQLSAQLKDQMSVFVGQSGVGKSSLINALCPQAAAKVGKLSDASATGRHTTTTADLFPLPGGGNIIDSPGIREFGLLHLEQHQLINAFIEFRPFLGQCRFRNCSHHKEPDCALREACANGEISAQRLDSFFRISESLKNE